MTKNNKFHMVSFLQCCSSIPDDSFERKIYARQLLQQEDFLRGFSLFVSSFIQLVTFQDLTLTTCPISATVILVKKKELEVSSTRKINEIIFGESEIYETEKPEGKGCWEQERCPVPELK